MSEHFNVLGARWNEAEAAVDLTVDGRSDQELIDPGLRTKGGLVSTLATRWREVPVRAALLRFRDPDGHGGDAWPREP